MRWVGEAEMQACQKPHPQHGDPPWEQSHKYRTPPWGVSGLCPTSSIPTVGTCTGEMNPQMSGVLKRNGAYTQGNHSTIRNGDSTLTGLVCRLIHPGPSRKVRVWKALISHMKEIHLLILKHLPEGPVFWASPGMEALGSLPLPR